MRYSRQRDLITDIVKGRHDHPTADMIYLDARKVDPNISLGTVYRNLKLLSDEKLILTLETEDKKIHYDGDISDHSHFICTHCGKIIDIFTPAVIPTELKSHEFTITGAKCIYYGICAECSRKNIGCEKLKLN